MFSVLIIFAIAIAIFVALLIHGNSIDERAVKQAKKAERLAKAKPACALDDMSAEEIEAERQNLCHQLNKK